MALSESVLCVALSPIEGVLKTWNIKFKGVYNFQKKSSRIHIESSVQIVHQQHCKVYGDMNMMYNFAFVSMPEVKMAIQSSAEWSLCVPET